MDVSEGSLIVSRGGRPKAPEPGIRVSTWMPESQFDRLNRLANLHDMSVSKYVALIVRRQIDRSID